MDVESPCPKFSATYNVSVTIESNDVLFAMHSGSIGNILTAGAVMYSSSFFLACAYSGKRSEVVGSSSPWTYAFK